MDPVTQQSLTIIFGTLSSILVVGGGAVVRLHLDFRRFERMLDYQRLALRQERAKFRGVIGEGRKA